MGRSEKEMLTEKNMFGSEGTRRKDIIEHFNAMKLEAVMAYEYRAITDVHLGHVLSHINDLERELSRVCTKINMERERIEDILVENNIIE